MNMRTGTMMATMIISMKRCPTALTAIRTGTSPSTTPTPMFRMRIMFTGIDWAAMKIYRAYPIKQTAVNSGEATFDADSDQAYCWL